MANTEINKFITKRYDRFFDYSKYHCSQAGIPDEATDVLNEVLLSVLKKDETDTLRLLHSKSGQYTELDYYILRMIKLNVSSPTSPYQAKYKPIPVDRTVDFSLLEIIDLDEEEPDKAGYVLDQFYKVRAVFESLELSEIEREVFEFKFFQDGFFKEYSGNCNLKKLYTTYSRTIEKIKAEIAR